MLIVVAPNIVQLTKLIAPLLLILIWVGGIVPATIFTFLILIHILLLLTRLVRSLGLLKWERSNQLLLARGAMLLGIKGP